MCHSARPKNPQRFKLTLGVKMPLGLKEELGLVWGSTGVGAEDRAGTGLEKGLSVSLSL